MLRNYVLNIKYPKIVRNEEVYRITKQRQWSIQIKIRRLKWLGHVYRLDKNTPAAQSLRHATEYYKKKRGGQRLTWLKSIEKQLIEINIEPTNAMNLSQDREKWRNIIYTAYHDM